VGINKLHYIFLCTIGLSYNLYLQWTDTIFYRNMYFLIWCILFYYPNLMLELLDMCIHFYYLFFIRTNLVYANLIIYAFMIRRETQTAKTIRESYHGLQLMGGQQEWCTWSWWTSRTRGLIFTTIYYMLNNVVNLVKCAVFILLVVVMFNQDEFWSLPVTMLWDNLNKELLNY
jgi:hypothetical protein